MLASTAPPAITEQLIAVRDIAAFASTAFERPEEWAGRALDIAGDELTTPQIADAITAATGRAVRYQQISLDSIREQDPQRAAAIAAMYAADRPSADLGTCRAAVPDLTRFDQWLADPAVIDTIADYLVEAPRA